MRLFLIRHEACHPHNPTFWSPLTSTGLRNAMYNITPLLQTTIQPTHIYTSPLLRCIQTVAPYCAVNRLRAMLRCEYGLFERVRGQVPISDPYYQPHEKVFQPDIFRHQNVCNNPSYAHLHPFVDASYTSHISPHAVKYGERESDVNTRANELLWHLRQVHTTASAKDTYGDVKDDVKDDVVVLVTHRSVINAMLGRDDGAEFPMGGVIEVVNMVHRVDDEEEEKVDSEESE